MYKHIPISTHAEISALENLKINKYKKYNLLVFRVSKDGSLGSSKPCYHCIKQLINQHKVNINNVFYSDPPGIIQKIKFSVLADAVNNGTYTYISSGYRRRMGISANHIPKKLTYSI